MKNNFNIDADYFLLKACLLAEHVIKWDDGLHTLHSDITEAETLFYKEIEKMEKHLSVPKDAMTFCFSSPGSRYWRHRIMPGYKGNRLKKEVGNRKPICYTSLLEKVCQDNKFEIEQSLEADDLLGLGANESVMVSPDKDMLTIPGELFNPMRPDEGVITLTLEDADYNFFSQVLIGDTTDGYPGCKGIGKVGAKKILDPVRVSAKSMWAAVLEAFTGKGFGYEDALVNAQVAYILRPGDYDLNTREIKLWTPESLTY